MKTFILLLLITYIGSAESDFVLVKTDLAEGNIIVKLKYIGDLKENDFVYLNADHVEVDFRNGDAGWSQPFVVVKSKSTMCVFKTYEDKTITMVGKLKEEFMGLPGGVSDMAKAVRVSIWFIESDFYSFVRNQTSDLLEPYKVNYIKLK